MTEQGHDLEYLSRRISALERANRRWKVGVLLLLVILTGAALLTGFDAYAQRTTPSYIRNRVAAREFDLTGLNGRVMGRMAIVDGMPVLQFYDNAGKLWWYAPPKMGVVPVQVK